MRTTAGNTNGVTIQGFEASGNLVQGNYIGTDITGTIARGNGSGVVVLSGSSGTVIGGSTGTAGTPPGNLISGNSAYGVSIDGVGNAGQVRGNILGARADGLSAPPGYLRPSVYTSPRGPDARVQQITRNLLDRLLRR